MKTEIEILVDVLGIKEEDLCLSDPLNYHIPLQDVIEAMQAYAAQFENKWVDVKDEKANYYETVLVTDGGSVYLAWLAVDDNSNYIWTIMGTNITISGVTHWMRSPLPLAP